MPAKIARSAHRPPFELPKVMVAVRTSPLSCWKAGKTRIFTPVRESSGESRFMAFPSTICAMPWTYHPAGTRSADRLCRFRRGAKEPCLLPAPAVVRSSDKISPEAGAYLRPAYALPPDLVASPSRKNARRCRNGSCRCRCCARLRSGSRPSKSRREEPGSPAPTPRRRRSAAASRSRPGKSSIRSGGS